MPDTALLVIDIQNDYFPGGAMELEGADAAAPRRVPPLRDSARNGKPVIHVRHLSVRPGLDVLSARHAGRRDPCRRWRRRERDRRREEFPEQFSRHQPGADARRSLGVKNLVVAGMMTHMCVDATVRHAADLGYKITLLGDACATRAQSYAGEQVPARQVHAAFLAALNGFYAKVVASHEL